MTDLILFGNNVGYKINNYFVKQKIISYLTKNVDSYKLVNNIIKNEDDLIKIQNDKYSIMPNIVGDDYIFIATKIKENYFLVLIEKKTLSDLNNINYNKLNIIKIKIRFDIKTYNGTIFDGRVVNLGGCITFIINKCYKLYGEDMEKYKIKECHDFLHKFISKSYIIDTNMNTIFFKQNKIFDLNMLEEMININIKNSRFNFSSIDFISPCSSKTYRYYYNNQDIQCKEAVMFGKLINVDVIELYSHCNIDNKLKRIDIAHIPNIKTSIKCNNHVSKINLTKLKCRLDYRFKKWIPEEIIVDDNLEVNDYNEIKELMLNIISS